MNRTCAAVIFVLVVNLGASGCVLRMRPSGPPPMDLPDRHDDDDDDDGHKGKGKGHEKHGDKHDDDDDD